MQEENKFSYRSLNQSKEKEWHFARGLNDITTAGNYAVRLYHDDLEAIGISTAECDTEHYVVAHLVVIESAATGKQQKMRTVGQTLMFTTCTNQSMKIITRICVLTPDGVVWHPWVDSKAGTDYLPTAQELNTTVGHLDNKFVYKGTNDVDIISGGYFDKTANDITLNLKKWGDTAGLGRARHTIAAATEAMAGVMSAEDKKKLNKAEVVTKVEWGVNSTINDYTSAGVYYITGKRSMSDDGLPIDTYPYFTARLLVVGSTENSNSITQILSLNASGESNLFMRNCVLGDTPVWSKWGKLQQNTNVGRVASLDNFTAGGVYSGIYTGGTSYETFVLTVINNEAAATAAGSVRCISQFKYALDLHSNYSYKTRTGRGDSVIEWGEWVDLVAADTTDIQDGAITAQKLSAALQEQINQNTANATKAANGAYWTSGPNAVTLNINKNDGTVGWQTLPAATEENAGVMSAEDKITLKSLYNKSLTSKTDFELVETPARIDNVVKASDGFAGYRYDLQGLYSLGFRYIRFRGSNYTLANDIVRGLIVDVNGNVESVIETTSEKSNGWEELPITPNSSYLWASYTKASPDLYGELFEPEYVELLKAGGEVARLQTSVEEIECVTDTAKMYSFNMLNPNDLLTGYSLSSGQIISNENGIFSNKLFLEIGKTYTIKDVSTFEHSTLEHEAVAIFIAKFNSSDVYLGRDSIKPSESPTLGDGYVTVGYTPTDETVAYYRVLLQSQSNLDHQFDPLRAMIYEGDFKIDYFVPYEKSAIFPIDNIQNERISDLEENVGNLEKRIENFDKLSINGILLTGASFAYNGNTWFSEVCTSLGCKGFNKAISGESIKNTAVKMSNDTLYSKTEFENFDTLLIMHVHNQDVCDDIDLQENYSDYEVSTSMSYSQAYDYVLKKYAAECYAAKDNPESQWYGTQCGKPCKVVCMTHWHDSRTVFNDSIRRLRDKWGFGLIELDKNIGFSKNSVHPVTGGQVSVIHAQDTEVIDGVTYGWHPSRATDAYIQDRIAEIVVKQLSI